MTGTQVEPAAPAAARRFVPGHALERLRSWISSPQNRQPLAVFVLSRLLFVMLTYFGVVLFHSALHDLHHASFIHALLPAWRNPINSGWDTSWYIDIAQRGYGWKKAAGTSPTAFFPLYPLLIHLGIVLTHRSPLTVAMAVSNGAFLAALFYLRRLAAWELHGDVADRTVLYIAVFPTALFFFAGYSESLFLFLTVASFYHLRRRDWLLAGLFAGLASATRVTGILLFLPFAYDYARSCNFSPGRMMGRGLLGLLLVPAGLVAFMVYLHVAVGDALAFTHSQFAWQKVFTPFLWSGFLETLRQILVVQPSASFFEAHNMINGVLGGLGLICSVLAARKLPAAYAIYLAGFWLVTLSSPAMASGYAVPLISLSRYVVTLFPVFIYLGLLGRKRSFNDGYLVLSVGMLSVLTLQFINGGWVI